MNLKALVPRPSSLLSFFARRFVAGETAQQAIEAGRRANQQGASAILDYLGEDVFSKEDAQKAAEEYVHLLHLIHQDKIRAAVSLKVSQMGLFVSRDLCLDNLKRVIREASQLGLFVWFDMEGSSLTQKTIDVFDTLRNDFKNIGLCLQAYLVRTGGDLDQLTRKPFNVRLCKGAYKEASTIAYTTKAAVDGNFRMLAQKLMEQSGRGVYPAFATHDRVLIDSIRTLANEKKVAKENFEWQMLYGVQNQRLAALSKEGYRTSIYIPYGSHWLPYFIRRIRERKENLYFLMRNAFQR